MKKLLFVAFLVFHGSLWAQDTDPIVTDRPTQTPASSIMPQGKFLIETGFIREVTNAQLFTYTMPNVLFRYGVNEFFEVRLQQDYLYADRFQGDESGFNSLKIGIKVKLAEEKGWMPQVSLLGNVTTTTGQEPFKNQLTSSDFSFVFSNSLSDRFSLGYSIGLITGEEGFDTSLYTIVLGCSITDKLTAFIEPYGFGIIDSGPTEHRFNGGLIYLVTNNFQLDVSGGVGISAISPDYFAGFGAAIGF